MLEKIVIAGHRAQTMQRLLSLHPKQFDVLVINNPGDKLPDLVEQCGLEWGNIQFHDIMYTMPNHVAPEEHHVKQMLDWSENRKNIMVACHAGISRSSATAYLIACREWGINEAIKILNPAVHYPNRRIVTLGAKILNNDQIFERYKQWMYEEIQT